MTAVYHRQPGHDYVMAVRAHGLYIEDKAGRSYLDMCGGAAVSCLGHGHGEVVHALSEQLKSMAYAHTLFFDNEPQQKLATKLAGYFSEGNARVYFTSGGSEANETALKFAWQYWKSMGRAEKTKIISREFSYHGNTLGTLSVSGHPARRAQMAHVLKAWPQVAPCYAYRDQAEGETAEAYGARLIRDYEALIIAEGPETIAAFIAEPVVGASLGAVTAVPGYFRALRALCDRYDILLISDEIMCGSGRTGSFYAHAQEDFLPDIVTLAKGLGGGFQPLAATVIRAHVAEAFGGNRPQFSHGHTYIGHATACTAGIAVLDIIERDSLMGRVREKGLIFEARLREAFGDYPYVGDIRGRGLFWGMELVSDKASKAGYENGARLAESLRNIALAEGLMIYPSGSPASMGGNCHILFAPPYLIEDCHIDEMIEKLERTLARVFHV